MNTRSQSKKSKANQNKKKANGKKSGGVSRNSSILNFFSPTNTKKKEIKNKEESLAVGDLLGAIDVLSAQPSFKGQTPFNRANKSKQTPTQEIQAEDQSKVSHEKENQTKRPFSNYQRPKTRLKLEYEDSDNAIKIGSKRHVNSIKAINNLAENGGLSTGLQLFSQYQGRHEKKNNGNEVSRAEINNLFGDKNFNKVKSGLDTSNEITPATSKVPSATQSRRVSGNNLDQVVDQKMKDHQNGKISLNQLNQASKSHVRRVKGNRVVGIDKAKRDNSRIIECSNNQRIFFPFEPYENQKKFIQAMVRSLDLKHNGLLESPTGTGKTLSILTGSLGWLRNRQVQGFNKNTKIFYASRTHSQIKQLVKELKRTCYKPIMTILGSRDHLCVNPQLTNSHGNEKNNACAMLTKMKKCNYLTNLEDKKNKIMTHYKHRHMDIEDLVSEGTSHQFCSFYFSRTLLSKAHIIFLPYNYLMNSEYRGMLKKHLEDSIIIFDEAHNLARIAEESYSIKYSVSDLRRVKENMNEMRRLLSKSNKATEMEKDDVETQVETLKMLVTDFSNHLKVKVGKNSHNGNWNLAKSGDEIFNFFGELCQKGLMSGNLSGFQLVDRDKQSNEIKEKGYQRVKKNILKIVNLVKKVQKLTGAANIGLDDLEMWVKTLQKVAELYESFKKGPKGTQESNWDNTSVSHFRLIISNRYISNRKYEPQFELLCLTPKFTMKELLSYSPRSLIFTSGTLQPMESYEDIFRVKFESRFSCGHVIDTEKQLKVCAVRKLGMTKIMKFDYKARDDGTLKKQLGHFILQLVKATPKGMVVFFSSYAAMSNFYECWLDLGIINQMEQIKVICREHKYARQFKSSFKKFMRYYKSKGALFMGVCSGKLSEGIDFTDEMARMVIMVGVPFPSTTSPAVNSKKIYMNQRVNEDRKEKKRLSQQAKHSNGNGFFGNNSKAVSMMNGKDWYFNQALTAVNQAIGRIIRHRHDFGCIMLLDERYCYPHYQKNLSSWIAGSVKNYESSDDTLGEIRQFYKTADLYCSKFDISKVDVANRTQSLRERARASNYNLAIEKERINGLGVRPTTYTSLDPVKEMKRTMRNDHYKKLEAERLAKKRSFGHLIHRKNQDNIIKSKQAQANQAGQLFNMMQAVSGTPITQTPNGSRNPRNSVDIIKIDNLVGVAGRDRPEIIDASEKTKGKPSDTQMANVGQIIDIDESRKSNRISMSQGSSARTGGDYITYIKDLYQRMNPRTSTLFVKKDVYEKLQCSVCFKVAPKDIRGAKCGHLVCMDCWEANFKLNKLECPVCRERARAKNLISVKKLEIIKI